LEEPVGPVLVRIEGGHSPLIWLRTPAIHAGKSYASDLCAEVLGLGAPELLPTNPQLLNAGNPTLIIAARDKSAVDHAWLDLAGMKRLKGTEREPMCVFLFTPTPDGVYARMFSGVRYPGRSCHGRFCRTAGVVYDPEPHGIRVRRHALRL
jgi:predicted PhzF superfamily epimerase YddE/YHI9